VSSKSEGECVCTHTHTPEPPDELCPKGWAWCVWDCDLRPGDGFGECWECREPDAPIKTGTVEAEVLVLTSRRENQYHIFIDEEGAYVEVMEVDGGLLTIIYEPGVTRFDGCIYTRARV